MKSKPYMTVKASEWNKMQKETRRALAAMGAAALKAPENTNAAGFPAALAEMITQRTGDHP